MTPDDILKIEKDIVLTLKNIYDPEIPVNIYDLGLIYGVDVTSDGHAVVTMTLTTPQENLRLWILAAQIHALRNDDQAVIALLLGSSGASAHFLNNPLQRLKRDVDVLSGHVIFDYDTSRELAGALSIGMKISPVAMV